MHWRSRPSHAICTPEVPYLIVLIMIPTPRYCGSRIHPYLYLACFNNADNIERIGSQVAHTANIANTFDASAHLVPSFGIGGGASAP